MKVEFLSPTPSLPDEDKMIDEFITDDRNCMMENVSYLEDKSLIQILPLECPANFPQATVYNRILDSTSKEKQVIPEDISFLEDKSLVQKLPFEYDPNFPQMKDNRILSSTPKKRKTTPELRESKARKRFRESGQAENNEELPVRAMKPPCNNCFLKCKSIFTFYERMQIHQSFWNMSADEKSKFYFKFVARHPVKRRRSSSNLKQYSFFYYFEKDKITYRVCRTFFLNTLCIDQKRIYYCFEHLEDANTVPPILRKKGKVVEKVNSLKKLSEVRAHISSFPVIESHYCQADSQKKYIDGSLNMNRMYTLYSQNNKNPVGSHIYREIFNKEFNISFIKPKKDQCDKCVLFNSREQDITEKEALKSARDNDILNMDSTNMSKLPLECSSTPPQTKENNKMLPSPSKQRQKTPELQESNLRKRLGKSGPADESINKKELTARAMKPPCNNCFFKCESIFSFNDRMHIHQSFWNMSDDDKSKFYFKFVARHPVKRRRSSSNLKQFTFFYYFEKDAITYRVCRTFFLNTLCIDQKRIYYCYEHLNDASTGLPLPRKKGKNVKKVTSHEKLSEVRVHISSFPAIEFHYCRADSHKKYIDGSLNINRMYALYSQNNENPVGIHIYREIFNKEFNISFFRPKKDKCDKCVLFNNKENILTTKEKYIYKQHVAEKDALKSDRDNDRLNMDSTKCTICYDLQSVFSLPKGNASIFYYKRKLIMYNLTATIIMPNIPNFTYCALWTEAHSGQSGNDIASALIKILKELVNDYPSVKTLILWSDSCMPQNRNPINSTAIKMFIHSKQNNIDTVVHKFSESGHSLIQEVDCIHAVIDNYLKNIEIHSPRHLMKLLKTMPYNKTKLIVLEMLPDDFHTYSLVANKMDFTKVPYDKIKVLLYSKQNEFSLHYKTSTRDEEYKNAVLVKSASKKCLKTSPSLLAHSLRTSKPSTIPSDKKADIKDLLKFLPHVDKTYYKSLLNI